MITIFNRAELLFTYDQAEFDHIRGNLRHAGIDYQYRTRDLAVRSGARGRTSTFGLNNSVRIEYKIYVRKEDLDRAKSCLL